MNGRSICYCKGFAYVKLKTSHTIYNFYVYIDILVNFVLYWIIPKNLIFVSSPKRYYYVKSIYKYNRCPKLKVSGLEF